MWLDGKNILILFKEVQFFSCNSLEYHDKRQKKRNRLGKVHFQ